MILLTEVLFSSVFMIVMKIIREEIEVHGVPANRIVLGGFSQGCVLALLTGLTAEYNFAGLVALSGYMPMHTKIMDMVSEASKKTPIFWGHGDADQVIISAHPSARWDNSMYWI